MKIVKYLLFVCVVISGCRTDDDGFICEGATDYNVEFAYTSNQIINRESWVYISNTDRHITEEVLLLHNSSGVNLSVNEACEDRYTINFGQVFTGNPDLIPYELTMTSLVDYPNNEQVGPLASIEQPRLITTQEIRILNVPEIDSVALNLNPGFLPSEGTRLSYEVNNNELTITIPGTIPNHTYNDKGLLLIREASSGIFRGIIISLLEEENQEYNFNDHDLFLRSKEIEFVGRTVTYYRMAIIGEEFPNEEIHLDEGIIENNKVWTIVPEDSTLIVIETNHGFGDFDRVTRWYTSSTIEARLLGNTYSIPAIHEVNDVQIDYPRISFSVSENCYGSISCSSDSSNGLTDRQRIISTLNAGDNSVLIPPVNSKASYYIDNINQRMRDIWEVENVGISLITYLNDLSFEDHCKGLMFTTNNDFIKRRNYVQTIISIN